MSLIGQFKARQLGDKGFHESVLRVLGDVFGLLRSAEFDGSKHPRDDKGQFTSESGAVGGQKGENFVKKALDPSSYGTHAKTVKDSEEASRLFEQAHAALEKRGHVPDTKTSLPFEYRRSVTMTHPTTGVKIRLSKDYFSADPVYRKAGYKGSSRVSLKVLSS